MSADPPPDGGAGGAPEGDRTAPGAYHRVVVEADGGARGNPGPAGYGAVVRDAVTGAVIAERSGGLGVTTNNAAEYEGLIAGLTAAAELGAREVEVRMDSRLVVEQMAGRWRIRHPGLRPLAARAAALVHGFDLVRFDWVPRDRNTHADALANHAMDTAAGSGRTGTAAGSGRSGTAAGSGRSGTAAGSGRTGTPASGGPANLTGNVETGGPPGGAPAAGPAARPSAPPRSWTPPGGEPTRLILVRHGQTGLTASGRYSGLGDPPLSDLGLAQARATAVRLGQLAPFAAIVSSPLLRAVATAAPLADLPGSPAVHDDPDLIECDFGVWEGLTFAEVRERWPTELTAWLESPAVAPPDGESFSSVRSRVRPAIDRLISGYAGRRVVVVSHVSPIKLILQDALAASDAFLHRLFLEPCGVSVVDFWPDGGVAVRTVNDTAHLAGLVRPAGERPDPAGERSDPAGE